MAQTSRTRRKFDLGYFQLGGVTVAPDALGWTVTWKLKHIFKNHDAATQFIGQLIGLEAASRGDWHVHVTATKDTRPALEGEARTEPTA